MNHLRLPIEFDAAALQASLAGVPENAWRESNSPYVNRYSYYEAELIEPAIGEFDDKGNPVFDFKDFIADDSYFRNLRRAFECNLVSFRVTRLLPDGEIRPHTDYLHGIQHGLLRLHVPITSNGGSKIHFESGDPMVMNDGECWYGDFSVVHHLKNTSDQTRHHLVLDCQVNDWCLKLMEDAGMPRP